MTNSEHLPAQDSIGSGELRTELEALLSQSHPLMVEAFSVAAIPYWYDRSLFAAIRARDDGRDDALIELLSRYSFVTPVSGRGAAEPAYSVRAAERAALHRHWIAKDSQAYVAAHERAAAAWKAFPDANPYAQAQNLVYHRLIAGFDPGVEQLIRRFRIYRDDRQWLAIERLLGAAAEARDYLRLLGSARVPELDDLLEYLNVRLAQFRATSPEEQVEVSQRLEALLRSPKLDRRLRPYLLRAVGYALMEQGQFVVAIRRFKEAYSVFRRQTEAGAAVSLYQTDVELKVEGAHTLIALGDAHTGLAGAAGSLQEREVPEPGLRGWLRAALTFLASLPLALYLWPSLGRRVWHPQFWPALVDLDWIVARLFATAARCFRRADHILDEHGAPTERLIADEKLAMLYLTLGDAQEASSRFQRLTGTGTALGPYRRASAWLGLAEAQLRRGQAAEALEGLQEALPVLASYGDRVLETRAHELLGRTKVELWEESAAVRQLAPGTAAEGIEHLAEASTRYQQAGKWADATRIAEQLEAWLRGGRLAGVEAEARGIVSALQRRQYPQRYRNPLLIRFRALTLLALPVFLLVAAVVCVRLKSGASPQAVPRYVTAPSFFAGDLVLRDINPELGTNVVQETNIGQEMDLQFSSLPLLLGAGISLSAYLAMLLLVGQLAIGLTRLRTVEAGQRGAVVCLNGEGIALGGDEDGHSRSPAPGKQASATQADREPATEVPGPLAWTGVSRLIKANVSLWNRPLQDASSFALAADQRLLVVGGSTSWYGSLQRRVAGLVDHLAPGARTVHLDCSVLRSPMGALYLFSLGWVASVRLLAAAAKSIESAPGLPVLLFHLYPYSYFFMVLAPLWWGIVQPLRRCLHLEPRSRLPWWVLGAGLAQTVAQAFLRFRPLLTAANLYPPLITMVLLGSAAYVLWRARAAGQPAYATHLRLGVLALATVAGLLMATVLWRDTRAYYHLVRGNLLSTRALQTDDVTARSAGLEAAIEHYRDAVEVGTQRVWGLDTRRAAGIRFGVPPSRNIAWLSAKVNWAALEVSRKKYVAAENVYSEMLRDAGRYGFGAQLDAVHAGLAVVDLSQDANAPRQTGGPIDPQPQLEAIEHLDEAIHLNPGEAGYYLMRGAANHALGQAQGCWIAPDQPAYLSKAFADYLQTLQVAQAASGTLAARQRERARTGMGWIRYWCRDYVRALAEFDQAIEEDPTSSEAWLGKGYAWYALGDYLEVEAAWEKAEQLEPRDPTTLLSLGNVHWKIGNIGRTLGRDACVELRRSADYLARAADRDQLWPQSDEEVAFTYRTLGYVQYLVGVTCQEPGRVAMNQAAVDSLSRALELDPQEAEYWYRRGRLYYSIWLELDQEHAAPEEHEACLRATCLAKALSDLEKARATDPEGQYVEDAAPGEVIRWILQNALSRGDKLFADGLYASALDYYRLAAESATHEAEPAFKAGLACLALGHHDQAQDWYTSGIEVAAGDEVSLKQAKADLEALAQIRPDLNDTISPILEQLGGALAPGP